MPDNNPVNELIKIEQTNQELLKQIAINQEELLEIEKRRLKTEKYALITHGLKFVFYIVLLWISFVVVQKFTGGLMDKFDPIATSITSKSAQELLKQLTN